MSTLTSALALRLFTGDDADAAQSAPTPRSRQQRYTVRDAFERVTTPRLNRKRRSEGTFAKYRKAAWYWEGYHRHLHGFPIDGPQRCDPAIIDITAEDLDQFAEWLVSAQLGIQTHTAANQQQLYIEAILRSCGPRIGRKGGAGILDQVVVGERLPEEAPTRMRRRLDDDDWNAIDRAALHATFPERCPVPPPLLWRCVFRLFRNLGPRRCELLTLPTSIEFAGRTWPSVFPEREHPLGWVDVASPHGWLIYHTPKTRRTKGGWPHIVPLGSVSRDCCDALLSIGGKRARLLPIGEHPSTWRKWLRRIQTAAGIAEPYCFQELRTSCNRLYRKHAGRDVARFMLGHQPRGVNERWYDDLTEDAVAAANSLPQPSAYARSVTE